MTDVTDNLTNNEWRVRISCCNALADLLRSNVQFDFAECGPELWKKLFRVMDDIHEGTRLAATNTTKILSKVSARFSTDFLWNFCNLRLTMCSLLPLSYLFPLCNHFIDNCVSSHVFFLFQNLLNFTLGDRKWRHRIRGKR